MHDYDRPAPQPKRSGTFGGILVALGLAAAKFKTILAFVLGFKWLILAPKLILSFGSMFLSIWFYALAFGGWKIAVVFVGMILVHEMGHYVTLRGFGAQVSLPMFVPGLGAFVSSPMLDDPAQNALSALMGPLAGVAAAAACWGYGSAIHAPFWIAAAYIGFFLNLFNLIPALPFDGGRIAGAIDSRLWLVGVVLLLTWVVAFRHVTIFTLIIVGLVLFSSVPRAVAAWRGHVDPRERMTSPAQRRAIGIAYFALIGFTAAATAATHLAPPARG